MKPAIHRFTGDSKRGRQMRSEMARPVEGQGLSPEQRAWNEQVEARRAAKKATQQGRNGGRKVNGA